MADREVVTAAESDLFVVDDEGAVRLVASRCARCGSSWFPRRPVCGACGSSALAERHVGPTGTVYAATMVRVGAAGFDTPYCLAYLDVDDLRVLAPVEVAGAPPATPIAPGTRVRLHAGSADSAQAASYVATPTSTEGERHA
ncbi:zinc ribbon domain-containing protein [Streptomyces sp. NPDC046805]|uniref:Zn-ribbon domain-containing OB-fold protein n=1 Tax=Streptomyces sp. NPDC046805 TaxID=3155134 RepID=UPI0033E71936